MYNLFFRQKDRHFPEGIFLDVIIIIFIYTVRKLINLLMRKNMHKVGYVCVELFIFHQSNI